MQAKPPMCLELLPSNKIIHFKGPYSKKSVSGWNMFNPTESRIAFKVKTTAQMKHYAVDPSSGIMEPKSMQAIHITMKPLMPAMREAFDLKVQLFKLDAAIIANLGDNDVPNIISFAKSCGTRMEALFICKFDETALQVAFNPPTVAKSASAVQRSQRSQRSQKSQINQRSQISHSASRVSNSRLPVSPIPPSEGAVSMNLILCGVIILLVAYIFGSFLH